MKKKKTSIYFYKQPKSFLDQKVNIYFLMFDGSILLFWYFPPISMKTIYEKTL